MKMTLKDCIGDNDTSTTCSVAVRRAIDWFKMDCSSPGSFTGQVCRWMKTSFAEPSKGPDVSSTSSPEPGTTDQTAALRETEEIEDYKFPREDPVPLTEENHSGTAITNTTQPDE